MRWAAGLELVEVSVPCVGVGADGAAQVGGGLAAAVPGRIACTSTRKSSSVHGARPRQDPEVQRGEAAKAAFTLCLAKRLRAFTAQPERKRTRAKVISSSDEGKDEIHATLTKASTGKHAHSWQQVQAQLKAAPSKRPPQRPN